MSAADSSKSGQLPAGVGRRWWRVAAAAVLLLIVLAAPSAGQEAEPTSEGVIVRDAPMYFLPDTNRTPMRTLRAGTTVKVLTRTEDFYRVIYTDPRFGDDAGYVAIALVQVTASATADERESPWSQRGFVEGKGFLFAEKAVNDPEQQIADGRLRQEVFFKPARWRWIQAAAGIDLRANSYGQVEDEWRLDFEDRRTLRPRASLRRASASLSHGPLTLDLGRQYIRWGRADILSPTDRFAPRDFVNVLDAEFLPVLGARAALRVRDENFEVVVTRLTPSRLPVLTQRWTVLPPEAAGLSVVDGGPTYSADAQQGIRWSHVGAFEFGASFFNGFNHLPNLEPVVDLEAGELSIARSYPKLRTGGIEAAIPTRFFTLKGEGAFYFSPDGLNDEYALYVIEVERQTGEWLLDVGYAGEAVSRDRGTLSFAAERGLAKSIIGRASYTIDARRTIAFEAAVRQAGDGFYLKGEYSHALGARLRFTLNAVGLGGDAGSFLGQFRNNSHVAATIRASY